ncbi:MAG TPA: mechanosensitive ion channel family protein, partial [Bacillota bacterium]|nr:mechanosensitive ion channel family protein [Bacillota bacterium]
MTKEYIKKGIGVVISAAVFAAALLLAPQVSGTYAEPIVALLKTLGIIWAVYFLITIFCTLIGKKGKRAGTVAVMIQSICAYAAVILSVFLGLKAIGADLTTTLATVGVITLIIGFGAQSLIEDVITGIFLIAEGKYDIGDTIVLDDFRGKVIDVGMRTTTIEDAGGNRKIVNNSDIRNFQNRSQVDSIAVSTIAIGYGQNLEEFEEVIARELPLIYEDHKDLFEEPPKYLGIDAFQDSGILTKFIVRTKEQNIFAAKRELNRQLKLIFDKN